MTSSMAFIKSVPERTYIQGNIKLIMISLSLKNSKKLWSETWNKVKKNVGKWRNKIKIQLKLNWIRFLQYNHIQWNESQLPGVIKQFCGEVILRLLCVCNFAKGAGPSKVRTRDFVGSTSFNKQSNSRKIWYDEFDEK